MDFQLISFPLQALIFFQTGVRRIAYRDCNFIYACVFFVCVFFLIGATGEHKAEKPAEKERDAIKSEGWSQLQTKYDFQLISFLSV